MRNKVIENLLSHQMLTMHPENPLIFLSPLPTPDPRVIMRSTHLSGAEVIWPLALISTAPSTWELSETFTHVFPLT